MHFLLRIARGSIEHSLTSINYTLIVILIQEFFRLFFVYF